MAKPREMKPWLVDAYYDDNDEQPYLGWVWAKTAIGATKEALREMNGCWVGDHTIVRVCPLTDEMRRMQDFIDAGPPK